MRLWDSFRLSGRGWELTASEILTRCSMRSFSCSVGKMRKNGPDGNFTQALLLCWFPDSSLDSHASLFWFSPLSCWISVTIQKYLSRTAAESSWSKCHTGWPRLLCAWYFTVSRPTSMSMPITLSIWAEKTNKRVQKSPYRWSSATMWATSSCSHLCSVLCSQHSCQKLSTRKVLSWVHAATACSASM